MCTSKPKIQEVKVAQPVYAPPEPTPEVTAKLIDKKGKDGNARLSSKIRGIRQLRTDLGMNINTKNTGLGI